MSKHVLIIDSNLPGFETMRRAKQRGYHVSFIRSKYRLYSETEAIRKAVYDIDTVLTIEDPTDIAEVRHAIETVQRHRPVDGVITQLEICVDVVARICAELGLPFTDAGAVERARDKARAREVIQEAGLRSARFRVVHSPAEAAAAMRDLGVPVIVKPQTGYDSLFACPASTPEEAEAAAARLLEGIDRVPAQIRPQLRRGILVEELLQGPLVSAEIGVSRGRFHRFMISGRTRAAENECIELGAIMPADLPEPERERCFAYAEDVARALGLDLGILHIELIVTKDGPVLVEVNPRLMGGVMPGLYNNLTGDNIFDHLLDIHLGLDVPAPARGAGGFISSRKIMVRADGRLADRIALDWVRDVPNLIHFDPYILRPNEAVKRLDILARYQIRGEDLRDADATAAGLLDRFEAELGVALVR
ncbi:biotin carboxylase [Azospirillum agricola]|uniref:ATP-grasp domain-containing protein n=1 Tax=Azospirillum agricola TaxID=1720247 RepID=UPI001AE1AA8C|nr:ATP-grasp domain-containing protein [Azospirillum agricola]MBP2232713.1 biotin carboxylase [Azospirillum agricola]